MTVQGGTIISIGGSGGDGDWGGGRSGGGGGGGRRFIEAHGRKAVQIVGYTPAEVLRHHRLDHGVHLLQLGTQVSEGRMRRRRIGGGSDVVEQYR